MKLKKPYYEVYLSNNLCNFQLKINDMHAITFTHNGAVAFNQPINHLILESGLQDLEIKITPPKGQMFLNRKSKIEIKVQVCEVEDMGYDERKIIYTYVSPPISSDIAPFIKHSIDFSAEVPYKLNGWKDSVTLKDIPDLKSKLIQWYKMMYSVIEQKDIVKYKELHKKMYYEDSLSIYNNNFGTEDVNEVKSYIDNADFQLMPFVEDNLFIEFFGNGKVVRLINPNNEPAIYLNNTPEKSKYEFGFFLQYSKENSSFEIIR